MALSTRAKLAGLGGALALGVLGATGVAYAADGTATPQYVTTVDDGTTPEGSQQAPAPSEGQRSGDREDCPEKSGDSGGSGEQGDNGTSPAPSPSQSGTTSGAADA